MRLSKRTVEYAGIVDPSTPDEIRIEILGLRNAIKQAEERISRYEQALEVARLIDKQPMEVGQQDVPGATGVPAEEKAEANQGGPPLVR